MDHQRESYTKQRKFKMMHLGSGCSKASGKDPFQNSQHFQGIYICRYKST